MGEQSGRVCSAGRSGYAAHAGTGDGDILEGEKVAQVQVVEKARYKLVIEGWRRRRLWELEEQDRHLASSSLLLCCAGARLCGGAARKESKEEQSQSGWT